MEGALAQYLSRLGVDLALTASKVHARQHGPVAADVSEEESVLHLLDEASVVRVGRNMGQEGREKHEALLFGACKQMVLQSEDATLSSAVLEQLMHVTSQFSSNASQKSQWDKLNSMITNGAEVQRQGRKEASLSWAKALGPLLNMPPQGEASKRVFVSSTLKLCVERVQAQGAEELEQFLEACQRASAGEERDGNNKRRKLSSSNAASASKKSDSISLQDLASVAWEFCRAASSNPTAFSSRSRAIAAVFRGLADEEGEIAGRALVYRLGRDFSSQPKDSGGIHAMFILTCANALLLPVVTQPKNESRANLRSDLRELVCWVVGRLLCHELEGETQLDPSSAHALQTLQSALLSEACDVLCSQSGAQLPLVFTESVSFLEQNAHLDDQSGSASVSPSQLSEELQRPCSSLFSDSWGATMALTAECCRSPKHVYAVFGAIRGLAAVLEHVDAAAGRGEEDQRVLLVVAAQKLNSLAARNQRLVAKIAAAAVARLMQTQSELRLSSGLSLLGLISLPVGVMLDAAAPPGQSMSLPSALTSCNVLRRDSVGCFYALQAVLLLLYCSPSGESDDAAPAAATAWLCSLLQRQPLVALTLLQTCVVVLASDAQLGAGGVLVANAELARSLQQVIQKALVEHGSALSESMRLVLGLLSAHIAPFLANLASNPASPRLTSTSANSLAHARAPERPKARALTSSSGANSSSSSSSSSSSGMTRMLWQVVECYEGLVQEGLRGEGEASLMQLFSSVSLARSIALAVQKLPALSASAGALAGAHEFSWFLTQVVNGLVCSQDQWQSRIACNFVTKRSMLVALLRAHGCGANSRTSRLCLTPLEVSLLRAGSGGVSVSVAQIPEALACLSPLHLDLLLSSSGDGPALDLWGRESAPRALLFGSGLLCEDWASFTFACVHAVKAHIREAETEDCPGSLLDSSLVAVVRSQLADKVVHPALGHALRWHLLQLACSSDSGESEVETARASPVEHLRYALACAEVAAASLDAASLCRLLGSVIDASVAAVVHRAFILNSPDSALLAVGLAHLLHLVHTVAGVSASSSDSGSGSGSGDSAFLPSMSAAGVLPLLACGFLSIALGTLESQPAVRTKLLNALSALSGPLCEALGTDVSGSSLQVQSQTIVIFRAGAGMASSLATVGIDHVGAASASVRSLTGCEEQASGSVFQVVAPDGPPALLKCIVAPSLQQLWTALLPSPAPSGDASQPQGEGEGDGLAERVSLLAATLYTWEGGAKSGLLRGLVDRLLAYQLERRQQDPSAACELATGALCGLFRGERCLPAFTSLCCAAEFVSQAAGDAEAEAGALNAALTLLRRLPWAWAWAGARADGAAEDLIQREGRMAQQAVVDTESLTAACTRLRFLPSWAWTLLVELLCGLSLAVLEAAPKPLGGAPWAAQDARAALLSTGDAFARSLCRALAALCSATPQQSPDRLRLSSPGSTRTGARSVFASQVRLACARLGASNAVASPSSQGSDHSKHLTLADTVLLLAADSDADSTAASRSAQVSAASASRASTGLIRSHPSSRSDVVESPTEAAKASSQPLPRPSPARSSMAGSDRARGLGALIRSLAPQGGSDSEEHANKIFAAASSSSSASGQSLELHAVSVAALALYYPGSGSGNGSSSGVSAGGGGMGNGNASQPFFGGSHVQADLAMDTGPPGASTDGLIESVSDFEARASAATAVTAVPVPVAAPAPPPLPVANPVPAEPAVPVLAPVLAVEQQGSTKSKSEAWAAGDISKKFGSGF